MEAPCARAIKPSRLNVAAHEKVRALSAGTPVVTASCGTLTWNKVFAPATEAARLRATGARTGRVIAEVGA